MATVIIPTRNEASNIENLVEAFYQVKGNERISIIFVDSEGDGFTPKAIRAVKERRKLESISLIEEDAKTGLSEAVKIGVQEAKSTPIIVMDADMSYHPKYIQKLMTAMTEDTDIVIGSRFNGGSLIGVPFYRRVISRFAALLAQILLTPNVKDSTSGFAIFRKREILTDNIKISKWKLILEILATNPQLKVKEIPVKFVSRENGYSKMSLGTMFFDFILIIRLFINRIRRSLK